MTQKANRELVYKDFVRLLVFALMNKSDKVHLDLLSLQDLMMLKAKKNPDTGKKLASVTNPQTAKKRYAILTILNVTKNIHYPIELKYMEHHDQVSLKRAFQRVAEEYNKIKNFDDEARSSSMSSTCNEFWKTGVANYNPVQEENKLLKNQLAKLKKIKMTLDSVKRDKKMMRDDFGIFREKSELEIKKLRRNLEDVQTELGNTESQFSETQSSFNKDYTEDVEKLRERLSSLSIQLENARKDNKKKLDSVDNEYDQCYDNVHHDQANERKLRVKVRQLENEFEQLLKKIDIISRAKGFAKGRSNSRTKVERTQFRNSGSRKPIRKVGSNYSSPALRNNSRNKNRYSQSNRSNNNQRKKSPSAVSNGSKRKKTPSRDSSEGSENRKYSPSGRPRDSSPNGDERKPGAVQRFQQAVSPKDRSKGPSKKEIYSRYNGLINKKSKLRNGSNNSSKGRPGSGSFYSQNKKNASLNRSGSARSRKNSKAKSKNPSKPGKYLPKYEKEVKMKGLEDSSAKKPKTNLHSTKASKSKPLKPTSKGYEDEITTIQNTITKLQSMINENQAKS